MPHTISLLRHAFDRLRTLSPTLLSRIPTAETRPRRTMVLALMASLTFVALGQSGQVLAQNWPSKPIRIVLQFPPGGSTDVVARILAKELTASLGQPVIVENKPGADGAIAGEFVARAEPDGHTFFMATNTPMMQVPLLRKNPPYDPVKSFTPVSLLGRYVYVLVVNPSVPAKDVNELIAYARANPGKLGYGSYSGVTQLMHNRFKNFSKADMSLVPYKGEAPTIADILGNHVQLTFATPISTTGHIREGKLRALAVLLPARSALFPTVPTGAEAGLPPFTTGTWAALFGPAKLPADITAKMNKELNQIMRRPEIKEQIDKLGFEIAGSTSDELGSFVQDQLQAWGRAFKDAGMNPE
jgi:tripartite-type tricarboxylate transporter receptor subunit TctC